MKEFEPIKWNLPMPSSSPRQMEPSSFPSRSPTGLEYAPRNDNYASELFKTYENIASEQREQRKNPLGISSSQSRIENQEKSDRQQAIQNVMGGGSVETSQGLNLSPNVLTPEGAAQVGAAGYGPIAGLESPSQTQNAVSAIETNQTLYTQTATKISAQSAKGPEKIPEAPSSPMPVAPSMHGKDTSEKSFNTGKDKTATLKQIAVLRMSYPPWAIQGLMG